MPPRQTDKLVSAVVAEHSLSLSGKTGFSSHSHFHLNASLTSVASWSFPIPDSLILRTHNSADLETLFHSPSLPCKTLFAWLVSLSGPFYKLLG